MKILPTTMLTLHMFLLQQAACTHLETCECDEIRALVNATVEEAISRLENKFSVQISNSDLTATVEKLLKPIQRQLDYHLPPPPTSPQEVFTEANPAKSCKAIYDEYSDAESGYYWIKASTGSTVKVYCKMDANCTGYTGGWMRVAHIDMRNSSHQCPSGFRTLTRSSNPRRVCDTTSYSLSSCPNTTFSVHGLSYRHVYGRISAYQNGHAIAFHFSSTSYNINNIPSIDQVYVNGVSLTCGRNPRKHIWTFAGAADETTGRLDLKCPCTNRYMSTSRIRIPSFIGNDYFCDTSLTNSHSIVTSKICTQTIPFGMGMDVVQTIHAALFQICAPKVHRGL
jgi:hypothetical protein